MNHTTWSTTAVSDERDAELFVQAKTAVATLTARLQEEKARRLDQLAPGPTSADPATNPDPERRNGGVKCESCVCCGTPEDLPEEDWVDGKPPTFRTVKSAGGEVWVLCDQCPDEPWDD